jgi:hypothetical protein
MKFQAQNLPDRIFCGTYAEVSKLCLFLNLSIWYVPDAYPYFLKNEYI